jgi:hypothetical protein
MKTLLSLVAIGAAAYAADWLNDGGDPQHSGWQRHERSLNVRNVGGMKLLWKRQLDNQSRDLNALSTPTMLGPIVTHRGIKELVFVAGSSDNLYAVDADLGRVFWKRHFDSAAPQDPNPQWPCGAGMTAAPAIAPDPDLPYDAPMKEEEEDDFTSLLPIYALSSDGRLHTVRPSDGVETAAALAFIPSNANASNLYRVGVTIYATTSDRCAGAADGVWTMDVNHPDTMVHFSATKHRDAGNAGAFKSSLASWEDAKGTHWNYAAGPAGIRAYTLSGDAGHPQLTLAWTAPTISAPQQPAVANGILFVLASGVFTGQTSSAQEIASKSTHATLYALDAVTGKELYSSGNAITSFSYSSGLAVANGHVCFGTWDNQLYCFGLPLEI